MADNEELDTLLDDALDDFKPKEPKEEKMPTAGPGGPSRGKSVLTKKIDRLGKVTPEVDDDEDDDEPKGPLPRVKGLAFDPLAKKPKKKKDGKKEVSIPAAADDQLIESMAQNLAKAMEDLKNQGQEAGSSNKDNDDDELKATLAALAEQTRSTGVENFDEAGDESVNEALYANLVSQFENLENDDSAKSMMENMMQHLLSKEVLYQPLKDIGSQYPDWLNKNKASLPPDDYARYSSQHDLIRNLLQVYDSDNDFDKIVELLQQMQECGQPPEELVKSLAAGVEFGEDGLPKFPTAPAGDMPAELANCAIA